MEDDIKNFISDILKDVREIRERDMEVKERLPIEIMALNAVANAYEKTN